ncbi:MAG: PD-(D/E)XK nuclease family protein, partial [Nodosilinea sp.]
MEYNLLTSLRKYRPRENQDPLENFVTEAFAWLLKNNKNFSDFFLKKILMRLPTYSGLNLQADFDCKWATQRNFGGIFPDMVAELSDGTLLVFEHKVWAQLHPGQLASYKQFSNANYSKSYLILITASESQHIQQPDLALCWRDIHIWIQEWIQVGEEKPEFIFQDFLNLLREEGLGPIAPVSYDAILSYFPARDFKEQVVDLIQQAEKRDWSLIDSRITVSGDIKKNGRVSY